MSDASTRLRAAREKAGYSSAAAAARARGWREATYRHHENGTRRVSRDYAEEYGTAFDVSPAWLLGLSVAADRSVEERISGMMRKFDGYHAELGDLDEQVREIIGSQLVRLHTIESINRYGPAALYTIEDGNVAFPISLINSLYNVRPEDIVAVTSVSSDMAPTIKPGALMLIDAGNTVPTEHDQIWLFSFAGLSTVRRLRYRSSELAIAIGDSPSAKEMNVEVADPSFAIHGRVVWIGQAE